MRPVGEYASLVFDCDGVVLDSNRVKTEAFRQAALPYGEALAEALVQHHVANGGVSRYLKFAHFIDHIVPEGCSGPDKDALLARYAHFVQEGLRACAVTPGLDELRRATSGSRWFIVSGGDQAELRELFAERGLAELFDGGIFGSPDPKGVILSREISSGRMPGPGLFLGDSTYDHSASTGAGLDFIFVTDWTEVADWPMFVREVDAPFISRPSQLLDPSC